MGGGNYSNQFAISCYQMQPKISWAVGIIIFVWERERELFVWVGRNCFSLRVSCSFSQKTEQLLTFFLLKNKNCIYFLRSVLVIMQDAIYWFEWFRDLFGVWWLLLISGFVLSLDLSKPQARSWHPLGIVSPPLNVKAIALH